MDYNDYLHGDEVLGYDEVLGDDDLGFSFGGLARNLLHAGEQVLPGFVSHLVNSGHHPARRPTVHRRPMVAGPHMVRAVRAAPPQIMTAPPLLPNIPGANTNSKLFIPLGLGNFTFVNAGVTTNVFSTNPQKPVRPRRLWIDIARSAGASGVGVFVDDIKIGTKSMLAGIAAIPAAQFAPGAFSTRYALFDSATPGIDISVTISLSATPAVGETVDVSVSFDCDSVG